MKSWWEVKCPRVKTSAVWELLGNKKKHFCRVSCQHPSEETTWECKEKTTFLQTAESITVSVKRIWKTLMTLICPEAARWVLLDSKLSGWFTSLLPCEKLSSRFFFVFAPTLGSAHARLKTKLLRLKRGDHWKHVTERIWWSVFTSPTHTHTHTEEEVNAVVIVFIYSFSLQMWHKRTAQGSHTNSSDGELRSVQETQIKHLTSLLTAAELNTEFSPNIRFRSNHFKHPK